ncbi:tyrosyl-DNA phosphodiesterase domain-containing protein [Hirsutella rhossiliensis]|uniref:Tyrosyl-DNA phosphodiesterase domain-containing protein n=1 Tax=Hirsutella rhossiliensis TaxID=111463 RepID=A0A9P8SKW8_9HYPO|nr:tyrosyl-DNA phosphodiesterase domain-containing protein [Hirsutella rhossiliensis]KAH0965659.1 tyrosyl-DNA phosphodiesterase domain-containing protein [Hirsutella rhossiliensis]
MQRPLKRQRTDGAAPDSLSRPISPPSHKRQRASEKRVFRSPFQLTWIRDLPPHLNQDALSLKDLLGNPLIRECWQFNFLHDVPFLMNAFDPDTRHLVKVHIVHGFWKSDDPRRLMLSQEASEFSNVRLHSAPMPEMFGTHHSKMMVLFRHDGTAQVIIHTANMIAKDWTNMTNAVWRSPLLPKLDESSSTASEASAFAPFGSGHRFKSDLLRYLKSYDRHKRICKPLADELAQHDFFSVKGALVASVPGKHDMNAQPEAAWGWAALKSRLQSISCDEGDSEIVVQISSMATLGAKDDWLQKTLFGSLAGGGKGTAKRPSFKVVFPTADEVGRSLDGYASGGSIHTKIQSQQQAKQLGYLEPMLHHWANDSHDGRELPSGSGILDGGRQRAAPHVKTYIRYNEKRTIDWALLTSANLSRQAWGEAGKSTGEMRIASWEIGVLVWPELYGQGSVMVGSFQSDTPGSGPETGAGGGSAIVGLRIPYSLPLQRYGPHEVPWVASMNHSEPDCQGRIWEVQRRV